MVMIRKIVLMHVFQSNRLLHVHLSCVLFWNISGDAFRLESRIIPPLMQHDNQSWGWGGGSKFDFVGYFWNPRGYMRFMFLFLVQRDTTLWLENVMFQFLFARVQLLVSSGVTQDPTTPYKIKANLFAAVLPLWSVNLRPIIGANCTSKATVKYQSWSRFSNLIFFLCWMMILYSRDN